MKKTFSFFAGFLLILMLAACNQTASSVNENEGKDNNGENKKEQKSEETSELTLEQVFTKSAEASETLKSFSLIMDMDQEMISDQEDESMNINSAIEMNVTQNPMAFYQKMKMTMDGTEESYETESYFTEDGMFLYEAASGQWMKFPQEMSDQLIQLSGQQTNPSEELEKLKQFINDFTFEQDEEKYILKLKANGEKFNEFIQETVSETLPPELAAGGEALNDMKINQVEYEIHIDKETFYPSVLNMLMDMEITAEGQTIKMKQNMNGKYSNYNNIDAITVPQEVLDSAVEMEM